MRQLASVQEFAKLPIALKVEVGKSLLQLAIRPQDLRKITGGKSARFIFAYAEVLRAERNLHKGGYNVGLLQYLTEVNQLFETTLRTVRSERGQGYCPGVGLNNLQLLAYALVRATRPKLVVETGVAAGVSSLFLLSALEANQYGSLVSIDLPNTKERMGIVNSDGLTDAAYTPPEKGPGWLVPLSLRRRWRLILGRSCDVLPAIEERPSLFLHDSEHSRANMEMEFQWAVRSGAGMVISDDINWNEAWDQFNFGPASLKLSLGTVGLAIISRPVNSTPDSRPVD